MTDTPRDKLQSPLAVVMAVHNGDRFLDESIQSILRQRFRNFQFIIVDDGSTDASPLILSRAARGDDRIRIITQTNAGLTASLNRAIESTDAPLIARMDGDDVAHPDRLTRQVAYLDAHPDVVCLGTRVELIDDIGAEIDRHDHPLTHEEIDRDLLRGIGWSIVHPSAMFRRDAFERVGRYDTRYRTGQDLDLFLRLAEIGRLANLPERLLKYRQHPASTNFTKDQQATLLKRQMVAEACMRRGLPALEESQLVYFPRRPLAEQHRRWGWFALRGGNPLAARHHAVRSLTHAPLSMEAWKLFFCGVRGR
jgi:glycosyltransferase involved in cell wall biosynthesis